jgi:hypothetical protein
VHQALNGKRRRRRRREGGGGGGGAGLAWAAEEGTLAPSPLSPVDPPMFAKTILRFGLSHRAGTLRIKENPRVRPGFFSYNVVKHP